jgi:hypothetical protein
MPKKRKRKGEIVVLPPSLRRPKKKLLENTTGIEEYYIFKASEKMGRLLSILVIAVGALLSLFSLYGILIYTPFLFSDPLFIGALGFVGIINIVCGLILLAKE